MNEVTQEPTAKQKLYSQGWTVSSAADELGVHRAYISMVLSGKKKSAKFSKLLDSLPFKQLRTLRRSK